MHVRLTHNEVVEAVREWLHRRGIEAPENEVEFRIKLKYGNHYREGEVAEGFALADVHGIELPIKDGPYR